MEPELRQDDTVTQENEGSAEFSGKNNECPHGIVRHLAPCLDCWEALLKGSSRLAKGETKKAIAKTGVAMQCMHMSERRRCKICKGSWICDHGMNKVYCKYCDGRRLCQLCLKVTLPRCYEVCGKCRQASGQWGDEAGGENKGNNKAKTAKRQRI